MYLLAIFLVFAAFLAVPFSPACEFSTSMNFDYAHHDQMPFPIDDFRNVEHFVSFLQTWTGVFGGQAGFYDCIATDTAESSEYSPHADSLDRLYSNQKAARIFVYLESDDIKDSENPIEVDAILPCNASNRNVKVRVYPNKKRLNLQFQYGEEFFYQTTGWNQSEQYACTLSNNNSIDNLTFSIIVSRPETQLEPPAIVAVNGSIVERPPTIIAMNGSIIQESTDLFLSCLGDDSTDMFWWEFPAHSRAQKENRTVTIASESKQVLIVRNVQRRFDAGEYRCSISESATSLRGLDRINITVIKANECYIEIGESTSGDTINVTGSESEQQWQVDYDGSPKPLHVVWYDNNDNIMEYGISHDDKYSHTTNTNANNQSSRAVFVIRNPMLDDMGNYTMRVVHNATCHKSRTFRLIVYARPLVNIEPTTVRVGQNTTVQCSVLGYPESKIDWAWNRCLLAEDPPWQEWSMETCSNRTPLTVDHEFRGMRYVNHNDTFQMEFLILSQVMEPGYLTCMASYAAQPLRDRAKQTAPLYVLDRDEPFLIETRSDIVLENESAELACLVDMYNFTDQIRWQHNGQLLLTNSSVDDRIHVSIDRLKFMRRLTLIIRPVAVSDGGIYECHAMAFDGTTKMLEKTLIVHEAPKIAGQVNPKLERISKPLNDSLVLECLTTGMPVPFVRWMLNDVEVSNYDDNIVMHSKRFGANATTHFNHMLTIQRMSEVYAGKYECIAENLLGITKRSFSVKVQHELGNMTLLVIIALLQLTIFVGTLVYLREHKKLRVLKNAGISYFDSGDITSFNPELTLMEQADLLPYDREYEFPRDKLLLSGLRLGTGTFGVVYKAQAMAIDPHVTWTTVAVKTVKYSDKDEDIKALISELKIMIHIGKHINVVNLLGAVTRNIRKRSLFVIVEYCDLGNLQMFLKKNRHMFVDQVDEYSMEIDVDEIWKIAENHIDDTSTPDPSQITDTADEDSDKFDYIDMHMIQTINTIDLVCWSFQVACGMAYLASRGVMHGDLAARNILLCSDRVVKICDFGLSRSLRPDEDYKKESDGMLPMKWLAIESISHKIFNTSTDVWSFGILMWELFSLARVPYTDVTCENMLSYLERGNRLLRPNHAPKEMYDLMLECWCLEPECRPSFDELKNCLQNMLPAGMALQYIERNKHYVNVNGIDDDSRIETPNRYMTVFPLSMKRELLGGQSLNKLADSGDKSPKDNYSNGFALINSSEPSELPTNNESEYSDSGNDSCVENDEDAAPTEQSVFFSP